MSVTSSLDSRKMSGLGINFCAREPSPLTPSGLWENNDIYAMHSPGPSPIQTSRKQSRWSESTRESRALTHSSFAESSTRSRAMSDAANPGARRRDSLPKGEAAAPLARDPAASPLVDRAHGRGSDDSQNSCGPLTPTDADADGAAPPSLTISLSLLDTDDYLAAPRKAPLPPSPSPRTLSPSAPSPIAPKAQSRRPSFSQSMMRTLSGRKKETLIPPPLELVPPVPSLPSKIELAPIVHHIELPISSRKNSRSGLARAAHGPPSPAPPKSNSSTPTRRPSDQIFTADGARRDSNSKTPRASFSSVFRSIRRSVGSGSERKISNAAPLSGVLQTTSASPIGRQRITSPVVSSPLMREARAKPDRPTSQSYDFGYGTAKQQPGKHAGSRAGPIPGAIGSPVIQRPTTAPSERMAFPRDVQNVHNIARTFTAVPAVSRSGTKSEASGPANVTTGSPLPLPGLNLPPSMNVGIEYSNPWSSYRPTASYVSSIPISPSQAYGAVSSRDRRRSSAAQTGTASDPPAAIAGTSAAPSSYGRRPSRTEAALYKASVLEKAAQAMSSTPAPAAVSASTGSSRLSSGSGAGSRTSRCIPPMNGPPPTMELPLPPADADDAALDNPNGQGVRQLLHTRSLHPLTGTGTGSGFGSGSATATENGGGHSFRTSLVSTSDSANTASVFSLELSPSQPAPPSPSHRWGYALFEHAPVVDGATKARKDSRSKSIDREAEKVAAPHLYLETLGATSLRNPFAAAVPSSSTVLATTSKAGSRKGSGGAAGAAAPSTSATIEYAFVRRRSSAKDDAREEGGELMRGKLVASPAMPESFRAGDGAQASAGAGDRKADTNAQSAHTPSSLAPMATPLPTSAAIALDEYLAGNVITPAPAFRNPFFARAPQPQPHLLVPSPSSSRRPSAAFPHTVTPGSSPDHPQSQPQPFGRKTRIQSDVSSLRRPSIASAASSSFGFPNHPTRLEVRRMTDFGSGSYQPGGVMGPRGLRVSLDTEAGEVFY